MFHLLVTWHVIICGDTCDVRGHVSAVVTSSWHGQGHESCRNIDHNHHQINNQPRVSPAGMDTIITVLSCFVLSEYCCGQLQVQLSPPFNFKFHVSSLHGSASLVEASTRSPVTSERLIPGEEQSWLSALHQSSPAPMPWQHGQHWHKMKYFSRNIFWQFY